VHSRLSGELHNLKGKAIWSGIVKLLSQTATSILRLCYLAVLARLLSPNDFGLVAMVLVITGIFDLFTTAGLSSATIQKAEVSNQQVSNLFWINVLVGTTLALLCAASASFMAEFYREPSLFWITVAMASGFVFNALGVQHSALLQRDMRYVTLSVLDTLSQGGSILLGIAMAFAGYGYWALVAAAVAGPAIHTTGCWLATGWLPDRPRAGAGIRSMLHFGGTITLNSLTVYIGYNAEKVLLGRFWGADTLGLYTRAVQLINLPVSMTNAAIGGVFFSALSRLQEDPVRLRAFFLKGYSLVMAVTMPATIFSALFADDIIAVVLGPNWMQAATIFRLMTPTILVFGIINPLSWLLLSVGLQRRSLHVGLVLAPLVFASYAIGLPYGPVGVAFCYSAAMTLWLLPHLVWCLHGTMISVMDLARTIAGPFLSGIVAAAGAYELQRRFGEDLTPVLRLALGGATMAGIYAAVLLFAMGNRTFYLDLLTSLKRPPSLDSVNVVREEP
jgi:O-antigen/teichoic acid export membrane protein